MDVRVFFVMVLAVAQATSSFLPKPRIRPRYKQFVKHHDVPLKVIGTNSESLPFRKWDLPIIYLKDQDLSSILQLANFKNDRTDGKESKLEIINLKDLDGVKGLEDTIKLLNLYSKNKNSGTGGFDSERKETKLEVIDLKDLDDNKELKDTIASLYSKGKNIDDTGRVYSEQKEPKLKVIELKDLDRNKNLKDTLAKLFAKNKISEDPERFDSERKEQIYEVIDLKDLDGKKELKDTFDLIKLYSKNKKSDDLVSLASERGEPKLKMIELKDSYNKKQPRDSGNRVKIINIDNVRDLDLHALVQKRRDETKNYVNAEKLKNYDLDKLFNFDKSEVNLVNMEIKAGSKRDDEAEEVLNLYKKYEERKDQDLKVRDVKSEKKTELDELFKNLQDVASTSNNRNENERDFASKNNGKSNLKASLNNNELGKRADAVKSEKERENLIDLYNSLLELRKQEIERNELEKEIQNDKGMKQLLDLNNLKLDLAKEPWTVEKKKKPLDLKNLGSIFKNVKQKRLIEKNNREKLAAIFDENGMYFLDQPREDVDRKFKYLLDKVVEYKTDKKSLRQPSEVFTESELRKLKEYARVYDDKTAETKSGRLEVKPPARVGNEERTQFDFAELVN